MKHRTNAAPLRACFNRAAHGAILALMAGLPMLAESAEASTLTKELRANINDVCVRAGDRLPPQTPVRGPAPALTDEQRAMAALIAKMDETPIGRELNRSGARHGLLWCAGSRASYFGRYGNDVGVLNLSRFGGADGILSDRRTFNRALRTMYEENAHAWQDHAFNAIGAPASAQPHQKMAWMLAIESSARVTAFSAINQHRLMGDTAVWNDNVSQDKNRAIMRAMLANAEPSGVFGPRALWAGFDAFYAQGSLAGHYQSYTAKSIPLLNGTQDIANDRFAIMGTVPGVAGNYMLGRFDADNPRYGGIANDSLRKQMMDFYKENGLDTTPLNRRRANSSPGRNHGPE